VEVSRRVVDEHLLNPQRFWLPYPVPSTAATEPSFVPGDCRYLWIERYWRGPTWLFTTWFITRGLTRLGRDEEAVHLVDRTAELVRQSGFREYFNPLTGEGMGARKFGVATVVAECAALADETLGSRRAIA
jgi:glycogen debranching enzyme